MEVVTWLSFCELVPNSMSVLHFLLVGDHPWDGSRVRPIIGIIGIGILVFFRKLVSVRYLLHRIGIGKVKSSKIG